MTAEEIVLTIAGSARSELRSLRLANISDEEIATLNSRTLYVNGSTLLVIEKFVAEFQASIDLDNDLF